MEPPIAPRNNRPNEFTLTYQGRTRVLSDDNVGISEAYDPTSDNPLPSITQCTAIWDTGASGSVIGEQVISELNLQPIDKQGVHTVNGKRDANVYLVNIYLRNNVAFSGMRVTDGTIVGASILIGMDVIGSGDFAVTHSDDNTRMSFQAPSVRKIDFVEEINTAAHLQNRAGRRKAKANEDRSERTMPL